MMMFDSINVVTYLVYATPLMIGSFVEFREIKKYEGLDLGLEKIRKSLYISTVRILNIYLFLASGILAIGKSIFADLVYENNQIVDLNTLLIIVVLGVYVFSSISFIIGIKTEKTQVLKNRKKKYISTSLIGVTTVIGVYVFKDVPYSYLLIFIMFFEALLSFGIGNAYFRYKNFDEKVTENDKMIDYKL